MRGKTFSLLKFFIGWPLSIAALFFLLRFTTPTLATLSTSLMHVTIPLVLYAIISFCIYYFLRSYIWDKILRAQDMHIPYRETNWLWALSELQRYIPGNIWSFVSRTVLFTRNNDKKKAVGAALVIESALIVLGAAAVALFAVPFFLPRFFPNNTLLTFVVFAVVLFLTVIYLFQKRLIVRFAFVKKFSFLLQFFSSFDLPTQGKLIILSSVSFFFFGLGYYFAIGSILFLHPQQVFSYIGLFSFALLLGYLSFITPTGLGVREALITGGLVSSGVALSPAGIAAVFGRLVLVLSELVFLATAYLFHRIRSSVFNRILRSLATHPYESFLVFAVCIYIFYFTNATFLRYDNFYTGRFDLGNMAQTVWNTTQGRFFTLTDPNGTQAVSRLAFHADFILVLFAPFYSLWPHPKLLLLAQTIVLACGAFFVYGIARHFTKHKLLSFLFSLTYLLNPSVQLSNLYDFHAVTLATTFLLGAFYFVLKRRYGLFILFALLAGSAKEQVWAIIALLGLYVLFFQKRLRLGLFLFLLSSGLFYFLIWHAIPDSFGGKHFAIEFYSDFGDSPGRLIKTMIFNPMKTFQTLFAPDRIMYLKQLFLPIGYLSFLSPLFLIFAGPDLLINLLSSNNNMHQIYYQYTATITPFLFLSAISGAGMLLHRFKKGAWIVLAIVLTVSGLSSSFTYGPLPGSKRASLAMFVQPVPNRKKIQQFIDRLPKAKRIAASNNLGAHLSNRRDLYTLPTGLGQADIVLFLLNDSFAQPSLLAQKMLALSLRYNEHYVLIYEEGDFVVFQRRDTGKLLGAL